MVWFTRKDRAIADGNAKKAQSDLKRARSGGDPVDIAEAKYQVRKTKRIQEIVHKNTGTGQDAYHGGPPGPRDT
jgi:hypothetical protein